MFKYVTTTIINTDKDFTTGLPLWSSQNEDLDEGVIGSFNVKRHLKFLKPNVIAIYKAEAYDPTFAKATIDLSSITQNQGVFRIAMYIRLSGSQNSYYANDLVFKGKPLYIEFERKLDEDLSELAKKVAAIAKKYMSMVYEKEIVKVSSSDTKVIIDATDEHQLFTKCDLEWYNPDGGFQFCCNSAGAYELVAKALPADDPEYDSLNTLVQGKQGFGTYNWLLHNFRLPTAANTRWSRIIQDETPILGAKYNEYIIEYCTNRGILGSDAVGDLVRSKTQHVFYVKQEVSSQFESGLEAIGGITDGRTGNTMVETALNTANAALTKANANEKAIATKANSEDVYTKSEVDSKLDAKAESTHTHVTADVTDLQDKLDAKADAANVVATSAMGDGVEYSGGKVTVKLDGASLTKSAAGLKVTE